MLDFFSGMSRQPTAVAIRALLLLLLPNAAVGAASLVVYNSTAFAGAVLYNGSVDVVGFAPSPRVVPAAAASEVLNSNMNRRDATPSASAVPGFDFRGRGAYTAVWTGTVSAGHPTSMLFGLRVVGGQARLWVDDHLLVDTGVCVPCNASPYAACAKGCVPSPFEHSVGHSHACGMSYSACVSSMPPSLGPQLPAHSGLNDSSRSLVTGCHTLSNVTLSRTCSTLSSTLCCRRLLIGGRTVLVSAQHAVDINVLRSAC
jgi:hypothetical protein